jgi:hypothetical protein
LKREVRPGFDFALTEVVHCKSWKGHGVEEARDVCSKRYLERVLSISPTNVFIVYGTEAKTVIRNLFGNAMKVIAPPDLSTFSFGDRSRIVAYLGAPSSFGVKTLKGKYGDDGLRCIREHLKGQE